MDIYSEKKAMKDLNSLYAEAVYGKPKSAGQELASREKRDDAAGAPKKMIVTRADKKANTPAYQNYKKGVKGYAAADHLKNEEYAELIASIQGVAIEEKKADKDYDGDGEVESKAKEYRGVIHNKIQQKKGGKEDGKDTSSVKETFNVKSPVIFSKPEEKVEESISEETIEKYASSISKAHKAIKK